MAQNSAYSPFAYSGLEVVPQDHQLPEVRPSEQDKYSIYTPYSQHQKFYADAPEVSEPTPQTPQNAPPSRRKWFIIGGIIAILVIIGAVLGGVLGSRAAQSSSQQAASSNAEVGTGGTGTATGTATGSSSGTASASATATPTPKSIRQGSSLSVASWRGQGDAELFLFFQDPQGNLRRSRYDGSKSSSQWETPVQFNSSADNTTRLAGTLFLFGTSQNPQTELFYSTGSSVLGVSINDATTPAFQPDSVNSRKLVPGVNSSVAAYWPWLIYQDGDGDLVQVRNLLFSSYSPSASWDVGKLGVFALTASRLAVAPLSTNITKSSWKGGYAIFYQGKDNKIHVNVPEINSSEIPQPYARSLPSTFPDISIPKGAPIAALAVARPSDSQQRVNTYVLYLDASSNINVLSTEDSSTWKTAQPDVMKDVDPDTDIACATMPQTFSDANANQVLLEAASGDTRCYFQRGGQVVEVSFAGQDWVELGNVEIP